MHARLLCAALLLGGTASAAEPLPAGIPDLAGPRAIALEGGIGVAQSNEGLYLNPAAAGARKRYSVEALGFVDRRGGDTDAAFFGASVVDSLSSPVAGGVSYLRAQRGAYTGNLWHLSLGAPVVQDFHVAVAGKYLQIAGPKKTEAVTADAGIFWQAAQYFSLGATGYNLIPIANKAAAPMGAGVGVGIGSDRSFEVTADWRGDFDRAGKTTNRYAVGAEVLLGNAVPLRAGWSKDDTLATRWWSVGAGLVAVAGVALDVGYRQSIDDAKSRTIAATLKLFLFQ